VEYAGHFRSGTVGALWRRRRTERHVRKLVKEARAKGAHGDPSLPLHRVAAFRDIDGQELSNDVAAVEVINMLRPVVAVGRFIVFAALQLYERPEWASAFRNGREDQLEQFAEEVRRTSPFFPFIGARAQEEVRWRQHVFPKGQWFLLDLYGTTHDPKLFPHPEVFRADRSISWRDQGYDFIPQGAGHAASTHRCPGEMMTVELIKESVRLLSQEMVYIVPSQDLSVKMNRVPALPESGLVLEQVKARPRA
ncbi:MAG TPA: cytochrome P450, partial [Pseudorhizobium sp.]|nr:cytochrome P450 [Pseudorhizobium sp.]